MLHRVWLTLLAGHPGAFLSLHWLALLYRDGLAELSWYGGTLLPGNLLTVLTGNITALLMGNIYHNGSEDKVASVGNTGYFTYAVSLRDLLTPLPPHWSTFLFSNRLAGLVRDISAMFFFHRATLLPWNLPRNFAAVRF